MGQMITINYIGAFIVSKSENFQDIQSSDEFEEQFNETGIFRTAYQGLKKFNILIPKSDNFAIKDQGQKLNNFDSDEFIINDFSELNSLEKKLEKEYSEIITKLNELYPNGIFSVRSGIVSYWDEVA